jgi:hypothetical protein
VFFQPLWGVLKALQQDFFLEYVPQGGDQLAFVLFLCWNNTIVSGNPPDAG